MNPISIQVGRPMVTCDVTLCRNNPKRYFLCPAHKTTHYLCQTHVGASAQKTFISVAGVNPTYRKLETVDEELFAIFCRQAPIAIRELERSLACYYSWPSSRDCMLRSGRPGSFRAVSMVRIRPPRQLSMRRSRWAAPTQYQSG